MLTPRDRDASQQGVPHSSELSWRIERVFMCAFHRHGDTKHHTWNDCPEGKLIPEGWREQGECGLPKCEKCALAAETHHRHLDGLV